MVMAGRAARKLETRSTRDLILDAAERRVAERGVPGVSVREIAADAGLKNQASLYHHFKNKKALYEAVLARGLDPIIGMVAASSESPFDVAGHQFLDRVVDYLSDHPQLPRLIQRAALDDSKVLRNTVSRLVRPLYTQGMRALTTMGDWEAEEMPHLAAGLYHLIFGYFASTALLESVLPEPPRSPTAVARQRRFLKAAVARLLGVPVPAESAEKRARVPLRNPPPRTGS
jgi:AcrR family transcriptional regulator